MILCVEDMRRVENVVMEEMVVTPDIVKCETEVGVRRCGKWRLGKTRPKLRSRGRGAGLGTVREETPRIPFWHDFGVRCAGTRVPPTWRRWRPFAWRPSL